MNFIQIQVSKKYQKMWRLFIYYYFFFYNKLKVLGKGVMRLVVMMMMIMMEQREGIRGTGVFHMVIIEGRFWTARGHDQAAILTNQNYTVGSSDHEMATSHWSQRNVFQTSLILTSVFLAFTLINYCFISLLCDRFIRATPTHAILAWDECFRIWVVYIIL